MESGLLSSKESNLAKCRRISRASEIVIVSFPRTCPGLYVGGVVMVGDVVVVGVVVVGDVVVVGVVVVGDVVVVVVSDVSEVVVVGSDVAVVSDAAVVASGI